MRGIDGKTEVGDGSRVVEMIEVVEVTWPDVVRRDRVGVGMESARGVCG
jgi:hypothetical protein